MLFIRLERGKKKPIFKIMAYAFDSVRGHGFGHRASVVELIVPMCCTKCEEKVRENMLELRGVQRVIVDLQRQRVVVMGYVDPLKALKAAKKVKRDSQLWTGAPYSSEFLPSSFKRDVDPYLIDSAYRTSRYEYDPSQVYRPSRYQEFYDPSLAYRTSRYEYDPSPIYRTSRYEYNPSSSLYGPSAYRSSYYEYTPSYGYPHIRRSPSWPSMAYSDGYSPVVGNPFYLKHIESDYY